MLLGELRGGRGQRQPQFLEAARHPHRPALVPEVALDLADHRGGGVRRELHTPVRVEPVHGLDQPDRGHLGQVVQRLPAVAEAAGQVLHQRQMHPHQPVAQLGLLRRTVGQLPQLEEQGPGPAAVMWIVVPVLAHLARPPCLRLLLHRDVDALGPVRSVHRMRPGLLLRDARFYRTTPDRIVSSRTGPSPFPSLTPYSGPAPRCL